MCEHTWTALARVRRATCEPAVEAAEAAQEGKREERARRQVSDTMRDALKTLPLYVWLVALPQLTSRICHQHEGTRKLTQHILTRVTQAFPHQARGAHPAAWRTGSPGVGRDAQAPLAGWGIAWLMQGFEHVARQSFTGRLQ